MILYFDNLITDVPLFPGAYTDLDKIRQSDSNYKFQDRMKVTLYSLASHAEIKWSKVIIKYQIEPENKNQRKLFEKFVRKIWPKAIISYGRSNNIGQFRKVVDQINKFDDDWIFYAGNNDHPFVAPNKKVLSKCLKKAEELAKKYPYVSVMYSHYPESLDMAREGTTIHDIGFYSSKIIEETEDFIVAKFPQGYFSSAQIMNKKLLNELFYSKDLSQKINTANIKKLEMIYPFIEKGKRKMQIVVLPKKELWAHFDGYSQTTGTGYYVPTSLVPPLFIPPGFFDNKIKIAYGYPEKREGWVNINPLKNKFSFEDPKNGTDLKISLNDLPLFWRKRIQKIDINVKIDRNFLDRAAAERQKKIEKIYFRRTWLNFPFYEAYVYQFRIRNLVKRMLSTIKSFDKAIKSIERKYKMKL